MLSESPQPLGSYYGAIIGLNTIAGADGVRVLVLPNVHALDDFLKQAASEEAKKREVDAVVDAVVRGLEMLEHDAAGLGRVTGEDGMDVEIGEAEAKSVAEKLGEVVGGRVVAFGRRKLVQAVLAQDLEL